MKKWFNFFNLISSLVLSRYIFKIYNLFLLKNTYLPIMDNYTRVEADNKTTSYKKFGAALGVAGITVAAALLLAGSSKAPAQTAPELIQMP